ncbi:MAG: sulfide:quinone oxidoreductase [Solirubrobacterales bacterium]|nr:sulfide:quinone oxidoreductase [Solirubrobacterales bacterium]
MDVLIAGGGIAGLEALMALRDLAGDRVAVTLVAPQPDFVYKPQLVEEPFTQAPAERHELAPLIAELGGTFVKAGIAKVRPGDHEVELSDGTRRTYDAIVLCVGARPQATLPAEITFNVSGPPLSTEEILGAEPGAGRIAFVIPAGRSWPLPAYELALMTRKRAAKLGRNPHLTVVTPESEPLIMFGSKASAAVAAVLEAQRIEVIAGARAAAADGKIELMPGSRPLEADRVIALPELAGPGIDGIPADDAGFIPIDEHARVKGVDDVYAAGDGANFPIKHGGLGTQQADAAAEHIAARAGAEITPAGFHPIIRGQLILGDESLNLQHDLTGGTGEGAASADFLWWPPQKVAGRYLAAWQSGGEPHRDMAPPPGDSLDVEVVLPRDWHSDPMAIDPYGPIEVD